MKIEITDWDEEEEKFFKDRVKTMEVETYDTYELRSNLAEINYAALVKYKEDSLDPDLFGGHPSEFESQDEWIKILDKMIWAFDQIRKDDWEEDYYSGESDYLYVPVDSDGNDVDEEDAVCFRLEHGPNHTFKVDEDGIREHQRLIQEGLDLYAKYFMNLWR